MSGSRKAIKILSIIAIVAGALLAVFGLFMCVASGTVSDKTIDFEGYSYMASVISIGVGIAAIIEAIIYIVVGALGVRGANDPTKIGPFKIICYIDIAFNVIGAIAMIAAGDSAVFEGILNCVFSSIIPIVLVVLCNNAQDEVAEAKAA